VSSPSDETVVETAATAARGVVFDQYRRSAVDDLDVTVSFEDGTLDVDVYLNPPDDRDDGEAVAAAAVEAAEAAVDELFAG
jgi:hypothetical protein